MSASVKLAAGVMVTESIVIFVTILAVKLFIDKREADHNFPCIKGRVNPIVAYTKDPSFLWSNRGRLRKSGEEAPSFPVILAKAGRKRESTPRRPSFPRKRESRDFRA